MIQFPSIAMSTGISIISFIKAPRFKEEEYSEGPGPCSYEIKSGIGNVPKYLINSVKKC
jgi:hypothetical protein